MADHAAPLSGPAPTPGAPPPDGPPMLPLGRFYRELPPEAMQARAAALLEEMARRRTVRDFVDRPVPRGLIETCLLVAGTAPSGANRQPWHFVAIGREDAALRRRLRAAAEAEERAFYAGRAGQEWLAALAPLGTDWSKPFLETAPWLIAIFGQRYDEGADGRCRKNYYVPESVGIATGLLIAALHHAGLATLTHTPSPMGFLNSLLGRPESEKPIFCWSRATRRLTPRSPRRPPAGSRSPASRLSCSSRASFGGAVLCPWQGTLARTLRTSRG